MKSLIIIPLLVFGVLVGATPIVNAQTYVYPTTYGYAPAETCSALTAYQQLGSTDASTGGQVTILQELLNREGYLSGVSGTFDEGTYGAVVNYQRARGIPVTGIVDAITLQDLNQDSCSSAYGYSPSYTTGYANSYGVSSGSSCTYIDGQYTCSYPVVAPVYTSGYGNCGNTYGYYSNTCGEYGQYGYLRINSLSVSYSTYGQATVTVVGTGFSPNGNTVYFGTTDISDVSSYNGSTLIFTVPAGYYTGTYGVSIRNSSGITSNTLQFTLNTNTENNYCGNYVYNTSYQNNYNSNCYNNGYVNNGYTNYGNGYNNVAPVLSVISGPAQVNYNSLNTWTVVASNVNGGGTVSVVANWGDGSSSVSSSEQSYASGSETYSFTHTYLTPGTYTLRLTATNTDGLTTYQTYTITVASPTYGYSGYSYYPTNAYQYGYSY